VPPFLQLVRDGELTHSVFGRSGPARVKVYGDTAVVTARVANTAHHGGTAYEADERTTDVLVRRDSRWRYVLSQITAAESVAGS
jgi:ketosteroid isomerase-like protein